MSFVEIINTIFIGPIKLLFEIIFSFVNDRINNPGYSIIFLSLAINILVLPLYMRADVMQKKAQETEKRLSDGIKHIKKSFMGDEKMMILQTYYRQNNYSPFSALSGSASLVLQIPFFMAAVQVLSNIPVLEGAKLGPISNLGAPDGLLVIGGISINLLPILMTLVNFVSSAIFSKDAPFKTKIQLYVMALFFLVFLYKYPSGLVFYWLLNNVFSLVKTMFYKLKNPKSVLSILLSVIGVGISVIPFIAGIDGIKLRALFFAVAVLLQIPLVFPRVKSKINIKLKEGKPNGKLFTLCSLFLTTFIGLFIPATIVAASPQEFINVDNFYNPIWYVVSALCLAAGTFLIWFRIFHWLASDKAKAIFDKGMLILCGIAVINYMFFGTNLGNLATNLRFTENDVVFSPTQQLINIAVLIAVTVALYLVATKKVVRYVLLAGIIALSGMSGLNISKAQKAISSVYIPQETDSQNPEFEFSKNGKNVVVMMLDRAQSVYVPYIMNERPELKKQFDGFVNYSNTLSYGVVTNIAVPALLGGYEYTPVELNKRDNESLASKHNEAHLLMPKLFADNGFNVTVCNPIYIDYQWISNLSFFDKLPGMKAFESRTNPALTAQNKITITNNLRNFFCFGLMKSLPLTVQSTIYNNGEYSQALVSDEINYYSGQIIESNKKSVGYNPDFLNAYSALENLIESTKITEDNNNFIFMMNDTPHQPQLLQLPDYTSEAEVDNSKFEIADKNYYTINGDDKLLVNDSRQLSSYHCNMATFIEIGKWLDYLREAGVYDNTRIILVADHGYHYNQVEELMINRDDRVLDMQAFFPLLMVKDFGATGFTTSNEFMTNADVPTLAVSGIIDNPINPFTKKPITDDGKKEHAQMISLSLDYNVSTNNGNTYHAGEWLSVKNGIWDENKIELINEEIVLKEHDSLK